MIDEKKDKQLCECAWRRPGVVGEVGGAWGGQRKACSDGRRRKESCLSGEKCVNASVPVSRMIIIAQFDWLADRRARRLLVVIWASGLRPLQLFLVCVCIKHI